MKIINLVENTEGSAGCAVEHGFSVYIETEKHRLLMDTGASELLIENAEFKGVDLTTVDTVILSHGHYDHGGGIPAFARINTRAAIYIQDTADRAYYSNEEIMRYIGLPEEIQQLPQVIRIHGDCLIDDELSLFSGIPYKYEMPSSNHSLKVRQNGVYLQDLFQHEQCLVIRQGNRSFLLSGCAHHGILNILEHYRTLYDTDPDYVISGFHMMQSEGYRKEDLDNIAGIAKKLMTYQTVFYTGHCTGVVPFDVMKEIMKEQLHYMHCGDEYEIQC